MKRFLERLQQREVLVSDGAMGTFLQASGLESGECPESWCVSRPDVVAGISRSYVAAGADVVETNSFGANALKLNGYGLRDKVREFNVAAAALARAVSGGRAHVAGSVGPTGHIAQDEGGEVSCTDFYEAFKQQVIALRDGGADVICIETMSSRLEAIEAVRAAKENCTLPVICTFTFAAGRRGFRTIMGLSPEQAARDAGAAGADVVGTNCGNGIADMIPIVAQMRSALPRTPILVQANAGAPVIQDGKTVFAETPDYMASRVKELIEAGAGVIGGCCGTTPQHIAAIAQAARS